MNDKDNIYQFALDIKGVYSYQHVLDFNSVQYNFQNIANALLAIERRFEKMESVLLVSKLSKNELSEVIEKYKLNER